MQITYLVLLPLCAPATKIKKITYLTSKMAEKMQESRTSDGAVKITQKERYQLGIENVSLKGLMLDPTYSSNLLKK